MRPIQFLVACLCLLASSLLHAQSLISQLPADGTWAKYTFQGESIELNGESNKFTGEFLVKCVGSERVGKETWRWIEIEQNFELDEEDVRIIDKVLISEDSLDSDDGPLADFRKMWRFHSQFKHENPKRVEQGTPSAATLASFLPGKLAAEKDLEARDIDTGLGTIRCIGVSASNSVADSDKSDDVIYEHKYVSYTSQQSPFGTVSLRIETKPIRDGQEIVTMIGELTLKETGDNAVSALPDHK